MSRAMSSNPVLACLQQRLLVPFQDCAIHPTVDLSWPVIPPQEGPSCLQQHQPCLQQNSSKLSKTLARRSEVCAQLMPVMLLPFPAPKFLTHLPRPKIQWGRANSHLPSNQNWQSTVLGGPLTDVTCLFHCLGQRGVIQQMMTHSIQMMMALLGTRLELQSASASTVLDAKVEQSTVIAVTNSTKFHAAMAAESKRGVMTSKVAITALATLRSQETKNQSDHDQTCTSGVRLRLSLPRI